MASSASGVKGASIEVEVRGDEDFDVREQMRMEEERLMEEASCYGVVCRRGAKSAAQDANKAKELEGSGKKVSYSELFRFAEPLDYVLVSLGMVFALANGAIMPMFAVLFRELFDGLQARPDAVVEIISTVSTYFLGLGIGAFVASIFQVRH